MNRVKTVASIAMAACLLIGSGCGRIQARRDLKEANDQFRAGRYDKALELYAGIPSGSLDRVRADLNSGYSHMAMYRFGSKHAKDQEHAAKAIEFFDAYLAGRPADKEPGLDFPAADEIMGKIITLLIDTEAYPEAIARMEQNLEATQNPAQRIAILGGLAQAYEKWGQPTTAIHYHTKVIDEEPELAGKTARRVFIAQFCWDKSYRQHLTMEPIDRNRWIDIGLDAARQAVAADPDNFEGNVYLNLLLRERAKVRVNPDEIAELYVQANEYQTKAKAIREAQKAAEEEAKQKKAAEDAAAAAQAKKS